VGQHLMNFSRQWTSECAGRIDLGLFMSTDTSMQHMVIPTDYSAVQVYICSDWCSIEK
jgi:hypothetical protein